LEKVKLTDIEKGTIILRLGAHGQECRSLREISKLVGMSVGRVAYAERKAIKKVAEHINKPFDDVWELYKINRIACKKRIARGIFQ
jgi:DNA-directed RNA polymerase sigma subunit (sigma70/sigma32)